MLLGHYGLALAAKRLSRRTSPGTLIPAAQWTIAFSALGLWLFVPWGSWLDRHRTAEAS